jgi:hypothetical protein
LDVPFEKLIETYDLAAVDEAEEASVSGKVVKPVLLPSVRSQFVTDFAMIIDGERRDTFDRFDVINPANGEACPR